MNTFFARSPSYLDSRLITLSVPWSVTASYRGGQDLGPDLIAKSSSQLDFFSQKTGDVRDYGIYLKKAPKFLIALNQQMRKKALPILALEEKAPGDCFLDVIESINRACRQMVLYVYEETKKIHADGKMSAVLGGDHSVSQGALRYIGEKYKKNWGLLYIDAHLDLRNTYQGFWHSHASILYNVLHQTHPPQVVVVVGARDYSREEYQWMTSQPHVHVFFDEQVKSHLFEGGSWQSLVDRMIKLLPKKVYISLDVDGLHPSLFPNTGTPVPGGLSFEQTSYLLNRLSVKKRQIIGFDLVEVVGKKSNLKKNNSSFLNEIEGSVGARLFYLLCQNLLCQN